MAKLPPTAIVAIERKQQAFDPEMRELIDSRWAPNTQRTYNTGWRRFKDWCEANGLEPLPAEPDTVCRFLKEQSRLHKHLSRISAAYGAIRWVHVRLGLPSPTNDDRVKLVMGAVKKKLGLRNEGKQPLFGDALVKTVKAIDRTTLVGKRDAAILLVGFWLALRRDSLRHLRADPGFLVSAPHGYSILLDSSKTDQQKRGTWFHLERRSGSSLCPVKALDAWLTASRIRTGPIFVGVRVGGALRSEALTGHSIAKLLKRYVAAAGLDPALFSGHSMRSGFVTGAMEAGVSTAAIRDVTGHTSDMMLMRYWRHFGSPSKQSPGKKMKIDGE